MNTDEKIKITESNLERLLSMIKNVDNKSALLLGINAAMLGILVNIISDIEVFTLYSKLSSCITILLLLASLFHTIMGSYPLTKSPPNSIISFEGIANLTIDEYEDKMNNINPEAYLKDLISQCHRNAEINQRKHKNIKLAFIFLSVGVICWIISIYLLG